MKTLITILVLLLLHNPTKAAENVIASEAKQTSGHYKASDLFLDCFTSFAMTNHGLLEQPLGGEVFYSQFGAKGDGITDDFEAIVKTHAAANEAGLKVRADAGATYYIGKINQSAVIQTDTDWGNAKFIIDDTKDEHKSLQINIFSVTSKQTPIQITSVKTLKKNQKKIELNLPYASLIEATDHTTMRFIREGPNQNSGHDQTDVFVVDKNGNVDMNAPIIWDYNNITTMTAYPIDAEKLTISGGHFTTIANQIQVSKGYLYYTRGIGITRSNVVVDGLYHAITGELDYGAPCHGFLSITNCTGVTVQNSRLSGHKMYSTIGSAGVPVPMGSYDISVNRTTNVIFRNCRQINDIHDTKLWGIMLSNYSKNITFDNVQFSRFDAHMGVANATIKNSTLGHQGINIIGGGTLLVENTKVHSWCFIGLRADFGSTFEGEVIIRNCEHFPSRGATSYAALIYGSYSSQHNFGYRCFMPRKITIDGLIINDGNYTEDYKGPRLFTDFNRAFTSESFVEKYPYTITEEIEINNLTVKSGKPWQISDNPFMFRNVRITERESMAALIKDRLDRSIQQYMLMAGSLKDQPDRLPKSTDSAGRLVTSGFNWWCSGYFPGALWYLYEYSKDKRMLDAARNYTARVERAKYDRNQHDIGLMLYCSYGNGYRITRDTTYRDVLLVGAESLASRFNPKIGCIKSWEDWGWGKDVEWKYPVIIDGMMCLELLTWAWKESDDPRYKNITVSHSDAIMKDHYRPDYSSYHVVSYNPATGLAEQKNTHQGYADESAWARGQAWGLYGYTMMYRETSDWKYLTHAKRIADFILNHPNLPADKIPYWDFDAPDIPNAKRDASATAVIASALIELSWYVEPDLAQSYLDVAEKQLRMLSSPEYFAEKGTNGNFILKHSVGHMPGNSEIDAPLTYADYYYIEALMRYKEIITIMKQSS